MMSGPWETIEAVLADCIGLDPTAVGANLIPRAVRLRMHEVGLADVRAYAELLARSEAEKAALIEEVVIPESWFFRDESPFLLLQRHARSGWVDNPARPPIRVLSIPCAAGEEPYSIVIALREAGLPPSRIRVDAVDISQRRLDQARRGIYSANAFRKVDERVRARYFRKVAEGFAIDPTVREQVRFLKASILDPGLLAGEPRYDVLFCRNLLIYLRESSRARAMIAIDRLLAPDGLLILGHADRLGTDGAGPRFIPIGDRAAFAYGRVPASAPGFGVKALAGSPSIQPPSRGLPPPVRGKEQRSLPGPAGSAPEFASHGTGPAAQPSKPVEAGHSPPAGASLLDQAEALANDGRREEAIAACKSSIRREGPTSRAYYLMGMIYSSMGNQAGAEESFSRAIYLDPAHDEALLALALIGERKGDAASAAAFRRRAERAASKKKGMK